MKRVLSGMMTAGLVCVVNWAPPLSAQTVATTAQAAPAQGSLNRRAQPTPRLAEGQTSVSPHARWETDANGPLSQRVEELALKVFAAAPVKDAAARGLKSYAASDVAMKPDGMRYAKSAIDETAMLASLYAAMGAVHGSPRKTKSP